MIFSHNRDKKTLVGFHWKSIATNTLSGIVFMDINNLFEIFWKHDRQLVVMILEHDSANEVFTDIKKFENIQSFVSWFSGISVLHPINVEQLTALNLLCKYNPICGYNKASVETQKDPIKSVKHRWATFFLIS